MTGQVRRLLENILRDRARLRYLPSQFHKAPIYMSSAGGLKMLVKPVQDTDPTLLATARSLVKPGNVVWDIGANIGLFSVAASALAGDTGEVYSFEPDVMLVSLLRRTAHMQPESNALINVVPSAVANETGLRKFNISGRARAANALADYGSSQIGDVRETQNVVSLSMDDLLNWLPHPDVVKIDIEGAELEVIKKESRLLNEVRPTIAVEVSQKNVIAMTDILHGSNYVLFDADKPLVIENRSNEACWNTIAIPEELVASVLK